MSTEWPFQVPGGRAFAFSTDGKNFFTAEGNTAWAYRDGKWLYSYDAPQPVGWFDGDTVFSMPDGKPRFTRRTAP